MHLLGSFLCSRPRWHNQEPYQGTTETQDQQSIQGEICLFHVARLEHMWAEHHGSLILRYWVWPHDPKCVGVHLNNCAQSMTLLRDSKLSKWGMQFTESWYWVWPHNPKCVGVYLNNCAESITLLRDSLLSKWGMRFTESWRWKGEWLSTFSGCWGQMITDFSRQPVSSTMVWT